LSFFSFPKLPRYGQTIKGLETAADDAARHPQDIFELEFENDSAELAEEAAAAAAAAAPPRLFQFRRARLQRRAHQEARVLLGGKERSQEQGESCAGKDVIFGASGAEA